MSLESETRIYRLVLNLARKPGFCLCCWCLKREDALRARRVVRLTRAVMRSWRREIGHRPPAET